MEDEWLNTKCELSDWASIRLCYWQSRYDKISLDGDNTT